MSAAAESKIFNVDGKRCIRCGECVKDCFFGALEIGADGMPAMANPNRCMQCQHCFAVCRTGAIVFKGHKAEEALTVRGLELPTGNAMANLIRSRRSIRKYAEQDVNQALLKGILKTLANAPTGCNARALKFTCIATRKAMDDFRSKFIGVLERHRCGSKMLPRWIAAPAIQLRRGERDVFFRGASGMLVVTCDPKAKGVVTPAEDVMVACSQFDLLAQASGMGTCWCGFFKLVQREIPELLPELVGVGEDTPFYAILFGVPAIEYTRSVCRDEEAEVEWRE